MSIRVLIAEDNPGLRDQLKEQVCLEENYQIVGLARDGQEAVQMAMQLTPDIMIIGYDLPGISGPQACEIVSALSPATLSLMVTDTKTPERIDTAMRSGTRGLIERSENSSQLSIAIAEIANTLNRIKSDDVQQWKDPSIFPKVISVTDAKGGVGKSTIAVNLAVTLAKHLPNKIAMIDLYTQFGDISAMFNVKPKHTLVDMVPIYKELDAELLHDYVTPHASGVHILAASDTPEPLDAIDLEFIDTLLYLMKRNYRYIIIDLPAILFNATLHVLAHSNCILLIANLFDLTTAADNKKFFDALRAEHIATENIRIVLNRVAKHNKFQSNDLERIFESPIIAQIPNDMRMVAAVNNGMPFTIESSDTPFGQSVDELAQVLMGNASIVQDNFTRPKKKKFFGII